MRCYYEELSVERDANDSDIKTAYRKLALKWHPDKNLNNLEEAKERFLLIQQAYEVLSDPQERAWYDNHREQILRGKNSDYEDNCLDVFQYFTVSCFKGYGDCDNGFYAVYREVFEKIAAEDAEFMDDEEDLQRIPTFGNSQSQYEEVVGPFYAYWSAYCTKRTYTWLCPYDIKDVKDRRILRQIEKDMKKVVQNAKKERNEEVRNLVSFIRKRDKRIQAYKKVLEERAAFNRQKQEQNRLEQIRRRQQELQEIKENSKSVQNDEYEEQLKQLELQYSSGEESCCEDNDEELFETDDRDETGMQDVEDHLYLAELYCVACNKTFKNEKAFANHEISKKHRDNIEKLKIKMVEEETSYNKEENNEVDAANASETENEDSDVIVKGAVSKNTKQDIMTKKRRNKNKKDLKKPKIPTIASSGDEDSNELIERTSKIGISRVNDKKDDDIDAWNNSNKKTNKKSKSKTKPVKIPLSTNETVFEETEIEAEVINNRIKPKVLVAESAITEHICATCKSKFESKNKLFSHLKLTNHGVYISKAKANDEETGRSKIGKGKRK